jgi:hypothetical protein
LKKITRIEQKYGRMQRAVRLPRENRCCPTQKATPLQQTHDACCCLFGKVPHIRSHWSYGEAGTEDTARPVADKQRAFIAKNAKGNRSQAC